MKPYAAFPELGGAKQLVCDGDRVVWDIGKVANNAQVQQSINDFDNPRRRFDVVFEWMDLEEFMEIQWRIYAKFADRYAHYHTGQLPTQTYDEFWYGPRTMVKPWKVDELVELMQTKGVVFEPLYIELYEEGTLYDPQEGRHRAMALVKLGVKKIPVWIATHRFESEVRDLAEMAKRDAESARRKVKEAKDLAEKKRKDEEWEQWKRDNKEWYDRK